MIEKKIELLQKHKARDLMCDNEGLIRALQKSGVTAYVVEQCRYADGSSRLRVDIVEEEL